MPSMPMVGDDLAGYRLRAVLGRGGMSVVYQAESPRLGSIVALKVLAAELAADDVFRARFLQESRIAAALNHPNVIPIYDMGAHEGLLYIAMRFVGGSDLRAVLKARDRISPAQALLLIGQAARALDAAHRHGLVHRDVKPANILVERGADEHEPDHAYLADFGITKHVTSRSGLTATGEFVGTIDYIAPEQIKGKPVDGRTDVYSLGCVLYECLTGRVPFVKDLDAAVIWAHVEEPPTAPSAVRPELPAGIDDVIGRALAKEPDDRYPTCRELASAASAVLAGVSAGPKTVLAQHGGPGIVPRRQPDDSQLRNAGDAAGASLPSLGSAAAGLSPGGPPPPRGPAAGGTAAAAGFSAGGPAAGFSAGGPAAGFSAGGPAAGTGLPSGAPPAQPGPAPDGPPPAGDPPVQRHTRRGRRGLAVLGVLVLIIAAVIGVWVGTRGNTAQSASHTAAPRTANPLMRALAKTNEIGSGKNRLPPASCHPQSTSVVTCSHPSLSVDTVRFHTYPTLNMLYDAYLAAVKSLGQNPFRQDFGDCSTNQVNGEVSWNHSHQHQKGYSVRQMRSAGFPDDKAAGRVFCTYMNSQLYMVWTQNDGHLLGTLNGSPHDATWLWWHAVHHDIDIPGSPQMKM